MVRRFIWIFAVLNTALLLWFGWTMIRPPAVVESARGPDDRTTADAHRCSWELPARTPSFQAMPVVVGRVLYVTSATMTAAVDATDCQLLWRYTRRPYDTRGWQNNRGVAVRDGVLYRGTVDGYLMALDAETGALRWERKVAREGMLSVAPVVWDSLVFIAPAGSELAIQGWVGAFRARDGAKVWRFPLIDRATWRVPNRVVTGGAGVWGMMSIDTVTGTLLVPTGNPVPSLAGDLREGANLYTNSVVALNARTGALRWFRQLVPNDTHDRGVTDVGYSTGLNTPPNVPGDLRRGIVERAGVRSRSQHALHSISRVLRQFHPTGERPV